MDQVHDNMAPWISAYPIISVLVAFALGFGLGALIFKKKKKE